MIPELPAGVDCLLTANLQKADGSAADVSGATQIRVGVEVIVGATPRLLVGPYTASAGNAGASWATGVVTVTVPGAQSTAIATADRTAQVTVLVTGGANPGLYRSTVNLAIVRTAVT